MGTDAAGVGTATSGSVTDQLTRQHRMTLDEAHLVLNVKRGDAMESIMRVCCHSFLFLYSLPYLAYRRTTNISSKPTHLQQK